MFKRIALGLGAILLVLIAVLAVNTARYKAPDRSAVTLYESGADADAAAQILSEALRFQTVSTDLSHPDFPAFVAFLRTAFPKVHGAMERVVLDPNTPLFRWQGSDPEARPVLLAAHYDVVPVAPWSLDRWDYPAFDGTIADGYIWGRGTLDDKGAAIAILAAAEHLVSTGFQPKRTIYFSFGGDEEIGGEGAKAVAQHLREQGVQLEWALDEGSFVLDDIIPGLNVPVASINLSEKGYATVQLTARAEGGHSALPPRITAVGRVARAVARLQDSPVPGGLDGVSAEFFDNLGRYFSVERRVLFANTWLTKPILEAVLSGAATTDAMLRTTTAPTMLTGSQKENVLATEATATVNFRLHPRDTADNIMAHVRDTIADSEIELAFAGFASEASPVANSANVGFSDIEQAIFQTFGPIASVPGLTIAATDARHYATVADNAYRINPFKVTSDDIARFHGLNERLSVENFQQGIRFYEALLIKQ